MLKNINVKKTNPVTEMNTDNEFDLKEFQREVFRKYESLVKRYKTAETGDVIENKPTSGLIKKLLFHILNPIGKFFNNLYFKSPIFLESEKKATEIIENPQIKIILCPLFKKEISSDFFKEELEIEVIIIVTTALIKKEFIEKFAIKKDKELFSLMIYKILQKDIENYCSEAA